MNLRQAFAALGCALGLLAAEASLAESCIPAPAQCTVSSKFGSRFHPVLKVWKMHRGTDFACPIGTNLSAVENGQVSGAFSHYGGGNMVVLNGSSGRRFKYMHMLRFSEASSRLAGLKIGGSVGVSGNTGQWTTGPHLHFEAWEGDKPIDPERLLCGGKPSQNDADMGDLPVHDNPSDGAATAAAAANSPVMAPDLDASLLEMYDRIINSRTLNPDYPSQLATLPKERLYAEIAFLESASLKLSHEKKQITDRIEVMNALRQILLAQKGLKPKLIEQRRRALSSNP